MGAEYRTREPFVRLCSQISSAPLCDSANTQVYFCSYLVGQRSCAPIERRRENQDPRRVPLLITLATKPTMTTLVGNTSHVL